MFRRKKVRGEKKQRVNRDGSGQKKDECINLELVVNGRGEKGTSKE